MFKKCMQIYCMKIYINKLLTLYKLNDFFEYFANCIFFILNAVSILRLKSTYIVF